MMVLYIYAFLLDWYFYQPKKGNTCISSKGVGNFVCGNAAVKINLFYEKYKVIFIYIL